MTRPERLERIGALLAKGVTLMTKTAQERELAKAIPAPNVEPSTTTQVGRTTGFDNPPSDETESAILSYLGRVGSASPRDIQQGLDLAKATAFRRLNRLLEAGALARSGKTSAIRYHLSASARSGLGAVRH